MGWLSDLGDTLTFDVFDFNDSKSQPARDAAAASQKTADRSYAFTKEAYDQNRADALPWLEAGKGALSEFSGYGDSRINEADYIPQVNNFQFSMDQFENDPRRLWAIQEGERGLNRGMASMGKLGSGNRLRGLMELNQGISNQFYTQSRNDALQNYGLNQIDPYNRGVQDYSRAYGAEGDKLNRLAALAGMGQTQSQYLGRSSAANVNSLSNILSQNDANIAGANMWAQNRKSADQNAWLQTIGSFAGGF